MYININFEKKFKNQNESWDWADNCFYRLPLEVQYQQLLRKHSALKGRSFECIVLDFFPEKQLSQYFFVLPAVSDRQPKVNGNYITYKNMVIRSPNKDAVPNDYDMLLFGDISINSKFPSFREFVVRGIDFIDSKITKYGELAVTAYAQCAFQATGGRPVYPPKPDTNDVLSDLFLNDLVENYFPIPNVDEATNIYQSWEDYLNFRDKYLKQKTKKTWPVKVDRICGFLLEREKVQDGYKKLRKSGNAGPYVLLKEKCEGALPFYLYQLTIEDKNKQIDKTVLGADTNPRNYQMKLQPAIQDDSGNNRNGAKAVELGGRFGRVEEIIFEPDCSDIVRKAEEDKKARIEEIERQFQDLIEQELKESPSLAAKRQAIRERLLSEMPPSDGAYNLDMFASLPAEEIEKIQREISKIDAQIQNIHVNCEMKSRRKGDAQIRKLREERNKRIDQCQQEKQAKLQKYAMHFSVDPREGLIVRQLNEEMDASLKEARHKLEIQYQEQKAQIIHAETAAIEQDASQKIAKRKAEKSLTTYSLLFLPEQGFPESLRDQDFQQGVTEAEIREIEKWGDIILAHNNKREEAKLYRQRCALNNFFRGVIKNPYLPLQLLSPKSIAQNQMPTTQDPEWFLQSLNSEQRKAVKLALESDGLFLLQGPPGTGKTQVIAELTAQLVKRGKKVAISSETHKAINNVFDRLPKTPDIRPIKLDRTGRESSFKPGQLVDNFYENIIGRLKVKAKQLEDPIGYKENYQAERKKLKKTYRDYDAKRKAVDAIEHEIYDLEQQCDELRRAQEINEQSGERNRKKANILRRTCHYIEQLDLVGEPECGMALKDFEAKLSDMLISDPVFGQIAVPDDVIFLFTCDAAAINDDLMALSDHVRLQKLYQDNEQDKNERDAITDEDTLDAIEGAEERFRDLTIRIKNRGKRIKDLKTKLPDIDDVKLRNIIPPDILMSDQVFYHFDELLQDFRRRVSACIKRETDAIQEKLTALDAENDMFYERTLSSQQEYQSYQNKIETLRNSDQYAKYIEAETAIRNALGTFIREFVASKEYSGIEEGMGLVESEWRRVSLRSKKLQEEADSKLPVYRAICGYLENEDIRAEDRRRYMRSLYERVNVYGFTSSAGNKNYRDLEDYGIDDIDIQRAGIDVVIIDEVSKSSFIDLLSPILYGKSVVLVGDHRQLPPRYDLRDLKEQDFEALDYIYPDGEYQKNRYYSEIYESSFFKQLFESVPEGHRERLVKQYRCHSHIMDVFNHFYGGARHGLMVGSATQDAEKDHKLTLAVNGREIITPNKHIFFVDSRDYDENLEDSTSKINRTEAEIIKKLVLEMNTAYGSLIGKGVIKFDSQSKDRDRGDERISLGVICTYGDQALELKRWYRGKHRAIRNFSERSEEQLMFDTVDNFQGDERDIIIVSMVRSPRPESRSKRADFISQYQRINVAFSRARRLLIVVGNLEYLSRLRIDLPDVYGRAENDRKDYPVFEKIIDTVVQKGSVIPAVDILGGAYENN